MTGINDDPMAAERDAYLNPVLPVVTARPYPASLERWQHYKGGTYVIRAIALHTDDQEPMVVYGKSFEALPWVRDLKEFMEVLPDGTPRFKRIDECP